MPQPSQQRAWGTRFDTLPSSPPISPRKDMHPPQNSQSMGDISFTTCSVVSEDYPNNRVVHDASIFVGSLPSNVDHIELSHLLSKHLSSYPEEKSIKAVRDSKGGTCAFIQCESPHAAARLLEAFDKHPVPIFLGRNLRFEPAKAYRTLLVSYKTPISRGPIDGKPDKNHRGVEQELPRAMKLTRSVESKFPIVRYNSEAITATETEGHTADDHVVLSRNISDLYLCPVHFDAETLRKIAEFFGTLEHFAKLNIPRSEEYHADAVDQSERHYYKLPSPHNSLRSAGMDKGCWEIKWKNRNDSISAHSSASSFSHDLRTQAQPHTQRPTSSMHGPSHVKEREYVSEQPALQDISNSQTSHDSQGEKGTSAQKAAYYHRPRALSLNNVISPGSKQELGSDHFPSLGSFISDSLEGRLSWADDAGSTCHESLSVIESTSSVHEACEGDSSGPLDGQDNVACVSSPDFGSSSLTPATAVSTILRTPTTGSYLEDFQDTGAEYRKERLIDRTTVFVGGLEPLGTRWDEKKVAQVFSKYGTVEGVKFVRPANKRSAFAFVKYDNVDSPGQAIKGEHNRIIDGRPIRVQLRTWNPHGRMPWKNAPDRLNNTLTDLSIPHLSLGSMHNTGPEPFSNALVDRRVEPVNAACQGAHYHDNQTAISDTNRYEDARARRQFQRLYSTSVNGDQRPPSPHAHQDAAATSSPLQTTTRSPPSVVPDNGTALASSGRYPQVPEWPAVPQHNVQQVPLYGGYPLYSYPPPAMYPRVNGSNSPQPGFQASMAPPGTNGLYFPIAPYPGHATAIAQGQTTLPLGVQSQAPIMPTGFIQGDQGILVPVYPPEALNQYMSNQDLPQVQRNTEGSTSPSPKVIPGTPAPLWRPYAHPTHTYTSPLYGSTCQPPHVLPHSAAWTNTAVQGHRWHNAGPHPQNVPPSMGYPAPNFPKQPEIHGSSPRRQYRKDPNYSYKHGGNRTSGFNRFYKAPTGSHPTFGSHSYSDYPRGPLTRDGWPR
ncbi:hypothetical protein CONPUDRAFT_141340 [Coniophora puteana RWD-64-598 SS2]|uniref:RRM domain-containing protein n=1 Tax=Coniophora puteana (strain RWD-64-598) TaxID=741705 RepID=A0A5M3N7C6_CONPW|nr:uncharacterized protein CONPUDRAFT_141340 [Coniophora puteana RWD-64-598 SS2]EIW87067.1 hypothetical protein CONPUDRAFT_141340 [Coniophora puteana RWD-64-598 SS2]